MNYKKSEKLLVCTAFLPALALSLNLSASAMHIMEGFLPLMHCVLWWAIALPVIALGFVRLGAILRETPNATMLLAMVSAFAFLLSALKIPSMTGSSSHPTGLGLGAILFGPLAMAAVGFAVLLFQALFLAHGGITTLGANVTSMAIVGPIVVFILYRLLQRFKIEKNLSVALSCSIGNLLTYCFTAIQLGFAHPHPSGGFLASATEFLNLFVLTQLPLALIEGMLSVVMILLLSRLATKDLDSIGFGREVTV